MTHAALKPKNVSWSIAPSLVEYGHHKGRQVIRANVGDGLLFGNEIHCEALLTENLYPYSVPVYLSKHASQQVTEEEARTILNFRELIVETYASVADCVPCTWRTVVAFDEHFDNIRCRTGDELVVQIHSAHLMNVVLESTDFTFYYVLPRDDDEYEEAHEFATSADNSEGKWRLTRSLPDNLMRYQFERMMGYE